MNFSGKTCDTDEVILHLWVERLSFPKDFWTANKPLQLPTLLGKTTLMIASLNLKGFLVSLIFYFQFTFAYSRVMNIYNMQSPPSIKSYSMWKLQTFWESLWPQTVTKAALALRSWLTQPSEKTKNDSTALSGSKRHTYIYIHPWPAMRN